MPPSAANRRHTSSRVGSGPARARKHNGCWGVVVGAHTIVESAMMQGRKFESAMHHYSSKVWARAPTGGSGSDRRGRRAPPEILAHAYGTAHRLPVTGRRCS